MRIIPDKRLGALLIVLGLLLPASAAAQDTGAGFIVLAVSGPAETQPGVTLAPGTRMPLDAGAVVTVLGEAGTIYRLTGPCDCVLPARDAALGAERRQRWAQAIPNVTGLFQRRTRGLSLGATPEASLEQPPDLWLMTVENPGERCVKPGAVTLWRRKAGATVTVDLQGPSVRWTGLTWSAGEHQMKLPSGMVVDGAPVVLDLDTKPHRFMVHVKPDTVDERQWGEILIWMAAMDCRPQAQFLVDGIREGRLFADWSGKPGLSEQ